MVALLVLALAGAAGAASPGANVGLVFSQSLGTIEFRGSEQQGYICAAPANGSTGRKVTPRNAGFFVDPDVSPSGSDVAYVASAGGALGALERVPAGGGPVIRPAGNALAAWPAWSSNGEWIFFASNGETHGGDLDVYAVPREGGSLVRMAGGPAREGMPAVSPDGMSFVFVRSDPTRPTDSGGELWRTAALGPGFPQVRLTDRTDITSPDWSPDGQRIVFAASDGIRVLSYTPDGYVAGDPLTRGTEPEFSPDGTRIAFVRDGDVWTMRAPFGGEEINVTRSPIVRESGPTWQSTGVPTGGDEPCAFVGTDGDDVITGSEFDDFFYDIGGDDVVRGLGGNDRVYDGDGNDRYELGDGDDRVLLDAGRNHVVAGTGADEVRAGYSAVTLSEPQTLEGGDGDDFLQGGTDGDRIVGGDGKDTILGQRGPDTIFAGPGNDSVQGNRGDDSIDGGLGDDVLFGGVIDGMPRFYDGYDVLLGRGGNDRIAGGWQKDRLLGGTGADRLRGGPHADHLAGESGVDDLGGEGGDDLVLARDRTRDRVSGGPGFDRARLDATDRRGGIERVLR